MDLKKYAQERGRFWRVLSCSNCSGYGVRSKIRAGRYSEPSAWLGWHSPYFKESHKKFRLKARAFICDEIDPPGRDQS